MRAFLKRLWRDTGFPWRLARIMLLLVVGLISLVMALVDKFIYFPTKYPDGFWEVEGFRTRERQVVPQIEDCYFEASDGVRLHGWYCTPHRNAAGSLVPVESPMVLLWFHGNAGNISYRYEMIRAMMDIPVRIFIIDYRGYGRSEGRPSEQGLYLDARAAWSYLIVNRGIPAERIIIFGKSLGGAPAIDLACQVEPGRRSARLVAVSQTCGESASSRQSGHHHASRHRVLLRAVIGGFRTPSIVPNAAANYKTETRPKPGSNVFTLAAAQPWQPHAGRTNATKICRQP